MIKGFIFFHEGRIPFVIEDFRMELFTDDSLLDAFSKEYNFKTDYILKGQHYGDGIHGQCATFYVERSMGSTCFLRCYIINLITVESGYDAVGLQSYFLDDIFRYKYKYIDMVREGINLAIEPKDVYKIPFNMNENQYEMSFRIGQDNRLGLWEDFDKKGEIVIPLHSKTIQECHDISVVFYRLAMFLVSNNNVPFKRITLYDKGHKVGRFYCPMVSEDTLSGYDGMFFELDVMKYVPKVLNNIALDSGNKITKSIPLGHINDFDSLFSPQRFVEQIMAFEYLFDKLDHKKAQSKDFNLKNELECMLNSFPQLLSPCKLPADIASERIKEMRRTITHGYAYFYEFKDDSTAQYLLTLLDNLIKNMSLLWIGFSKEEIEAFPIF